jgi:ketosteroid isomerase-like protein
MSQENGELARNAIDALNRGDFDALLAFLSPDVVWEALEGVAGIGELYRGRAGVREWIELMWENAEEGVHIEIEQITDLAGDRVFIAERERAEDAARAADECLTGELSGERESVAG